MPISVSEMPKVCLTGPTTRLSINRSTKENRLATPSRITACQATRAEGQGDSVFELVTAKISPSRILGNGDGSLRRSETPLETAQE